MKRLYIIYILLSILYVSCFDDEGNYTYKELREPVFEFKQPRHFISGYVGDTIFLEGAFHYDQADSVKLMDQAECTWYLGDKLIFKGKDLELPTDTLMKMMGWINIPIDQSPLSFCVTNKETGISYYSTESQIQLTIRSEFGRGDVLVLSENNGNSRLSFIGLSYEWEQIGEDDWIKVYDFNFIKEMYKKCNDGNYIPGNPRKLVDYAAKHISNSMGATTVITDKVAYDVSNENFSFYCDLYSEFIDGAPGNMHISDIYSNQARNAFIMGDDGKIYGRLMSNNYLGGKYINVPYTVDEKGYNASMIGGSFKNPTALLIYDDKNNRLVGINRDGKLLPIEKNKDIEYDFDITNLGENIEIIAMSTDAPFCHTFKVNYPNNKCSVLYKNKEDGQIYLSEFGLATRPKFFYSAQEFRSFPVNMQLAEDSKIWWVTMSTRYFPTNMKTKQYAIFYTSGNQLRYYDRENKTDNLFKQFDNKISSLRFSTDFSSAYKIMIVGFENGDVKIYDTSVEPIKLMPKGEFNVGGKIVDISFLTSGNTR